MVSEKLGAAFVEVGADLGPLEKSLGSIPGMMHNAGTNITGGLKASLTGGNFSDVGKQLGNQLVTGMSSQFGMLGQAAGTFATALGPAGIALLGIGASIAVIGVGLGKCVSSAATWQTLMVDVQKVTDTTAAGFSKLSSDLLAIRGETGASMESIAGAAAGAGRMGIDPTEIAGYTETILKMSSAWGMSADAASESIGKIGSVVKPAEMTWTEFGNRMGSTINDLADSMATSEESIVTGMKKVSAQMAMLKPSPDQLSEWAALIGQLQAFGMTAETSGESLKDALNYMMRDDKSGISSMLDMDATEFQEAIREDAIGIVQELAVAISELPIEEQGQALQKFGATGGQMMGMLVGKVDPVTKEIEGLDAALETGASAWENASSLNEAYAKSQETLNAQIDIFKGKISVAATSIGAVFLPSLTWMMKGVNDITQALIGLGTQGWQWLTGGAYELYEGLEKLDNKVGEVLSGGTETRGLVGSFVGDVTGALSDGLKSAGGQIKIGDEWVKDMADVQAARDAGKLTAQEYLSGLKEVSSAGMKGPTTGLMDSLQEFATTGKLTTDQYKKSLSSVSEIYSQVGDAAADMIGPLTEGFENGTVSAEDYISILEDMTTVSEELGDGADEALEPLTQAFEDGTVSAEEYKNIMDDVANAVTSLGSDFDSIAGPIQEAFSQGEISATQYQDAINSISDVHAQLGESTEYVIGPITEMFESGEISADEYITALDGVLSGSKEFGTEFTRQMADLNANAGNMSADEYLAAFNDIITDLGVDIEKELKDVDAGGAGSAAASSYMNAWNDKMKRWADYHEKTVPRFSRTGTVSVGSDTIEIIHTPDAQLEWAVHINGKSLTGMAYDSPQAAMNAIRTQLPGLWALIDPVEREAALLDALGKSGEAAEVRAQAELKPDLEAEAERLQAEFETAFSEALEKPFAVGGLGDKMADLLGDVAEDGWAAFEDGLITASEASDIETQLADLKLADPEAFEEAGGQAALSWWGRLVGMLEQRSYNIANNIDTTGINEEIQKHIDAGEPYIAEVTAKVSPEASALREALFWEEYGGSKTKKGLREFADDLYSLSQIVGELGSDAEAAYRIITNPWDYEKSTVSLAKDFLRSVIPEEIDPEAIDAIAKYFTKAGKAGLEKASAETTTSIMPGWWSGFGAWQEAQEDMFARSYIGPTEGWAGPGQGAKEGYEAQNYFQYAVEVDLELDPAAANTELEKLEGDIKTEKISPVLADISPAMAELDRLEAEIMAPTTKPIWLEVMNPGVLDTGGPSGGHYAGGTLAPGGWLSFAPGGIISSPVRAVVGDARTPEVVAPLGDLLPMIQQAVATAGGGSVTVNAPITVYGGGDAREIAREVAEELKIEISDAYVGRLRGGH